MVGAITPWNYPLHQSAANTYASIMLEAGESVVIVARWMGHASPTITLDY